jgi:hypothetical protein
MVAPPNNPAARELFAQMLADETNRTMLTSVGGPPGELGQLVAARKAEFAPSRNGRGAWNGLGAGGGKDATTTDLVALLFAESQVPGRFVPMLTRGPVRGSSNSPGMLTSLASTPGERGEVCRAVVVAWVKTRDDALQLADALTVAEGLELKETPEIAIRLLATPGAMTYRTRAASTLIRLGAKEHLPAIEKLMTDEAKLTAIQGTTGIVEIQVRDVALATAVQITGQKPEDYGFAEQYPGSGLRSSYANWYLPADKREAALDKWKAWRAKNPAFEKDPGKR